MATPTLRTSSSDATSGTSWAIPSATYTAGRLILVAVTLVRPAGSAADTAAISGLGATWTAVTNVAFGGSGRFEMVVYQTTLGADQTGTILITATNTHDAAFWQIIEEDDAATVVQSAVGSSSSATTVTATLAAFADAANGAVSFGFEASTATITPGSGWTELGEYTATRTIQAQWRSTNDTTADISWTGAQAACIIAMEIAAEVVTPPVVPDPVTGWGGVTLLVEVAFAAQVEGAGVWDSGLWDTATWGPELTWTDITHYVLGPITTRRGFSTDGDSWDAGSATIVLSNTDGRFSPSNTTGPYRVAGVSQLRRWRPVRIRATFQSLTYDIFRGYVTDWANDGDPFAPTATIQATDEFGLLGRIDGLAQASQGSGEMAGPRINRILDSVASTAGRALDLGVNTLQATTLAQNVVGELKLTAASDGGSIWVDGGGNIRFSDQQGPINTDRSREIQATFGDGGYLVLTGASGSYANCPDTPALGVTGDISIFCEISHDTWDPPQTQIIATKEASGDLSWQFQLRSGGELNFVWSVNGTAYTGGVGPVVNWEPGSRHYIGIYHDVDAGASNNRRTYYASTDGDTWTVLWESVGTPATSMWDGAGDVLIGAGYTAARFTGKVWQLNIFKGNRLTPLASPVFGAWPGRSIFSDAQGNVWTIQSAASIVVDPAEIHAADYVPETGALKTPNVVSMARVGGTAQTVADLTLRAIDGDSRMTRTDLICETDAQALALAKQALLTRSPTKAGFQEIVLSPVANAATDMPIALGLQIRDRVRIARRPPGGYVTNQECFIRGVEHTITAVDWRTRFMLSPAEAWNGFDRWDFAKWDEAKWFV